MRCVLCLRLSACSPEVMLEGRISKAADVYSVGGVWEGGVAMHGARVWVWVETYCTQSLARGPRGQVATRLRAQLEARESVWLLHSGMALAPCKDS